MTRARILFVQFAGDFLTAHRLLQDSGTETYYGHRYVLEQLARIQADLGETAMLCCLSGSRYQEVLPSGVTVMGADAHPDKRSAEVLAMIADFRPTHVAILTPMPRVIRWARRSGVRILCAFADSFNSGAVHRWWRFGRLPTQLNDDRVEWVANHGRNACRSLLRIGVAPGKVVPWDWPQARRPHDQPAKTGPGTGVPTLFFAGDVIALKGVGDLIDAAGELARRGRVVAVEIAGRGEPAGFRQQAERLGIADRVHFLGVVPNPDVLEHMRSAAAVVVPSRHRYPEGLPLTIYEGLCSRTPLIVSDHPMFVGNLLDRETALFYPAGQPGALADRVEMLLDDDALFGRLSSNAPAAWERLQLPVQWGELMYRWVRDGEDDRSWIGRHLAVNE